MPELPEVETVRRGLKKILGDQAQIDRVELRRPDIRYPIPKDFSRRLRGERIQDIERLGKYLIWKGEKNSLINHLGMSGSWRVLEPGEKPGLHDHCLIHLIDRQRLVYRDPRRFGMLDVVARGEEQSHPRLIHLGPDPLTNAFHARDLWERSRGRSVAVKLWIMDQRTVSGVGNIYACEALFLSGIHPATAVKNLERQQWSRLVKNIRKVLLQAIEAGGSTIRDFRQAGGSEGYFQNQFFVYGRAGESCQRCSSEVLVDVQSNRSTFFCEKCQPPHSVVSRRSSKSKGSGRRG